MTKKKKQATEELFQTQVLNIDEVRKVAKYERKVSKTPAAVCAFLGVIMLLIGGTTQGYITYHTALNSNRQDDVVERKVEEVKHEIISGESSMVCQLSMQGNENGTNYVSTFTYSFTDSKLKYIKKEMILDAIVNNPTGLVSMTNLYQAYQSLAGINGTVNGYSIVTGPRGNIGFYIIVEMNLQLLNSSQIPANYNNYPQTSIDYKLDTYLDEVKAKNESNGYICQLILPTAQQTQPVAQ